ncbi:MAG: hypothetical protein LRZ84_14365 [Desertifilum sp.]|nr:hypothetical protein [Desertifilum sp.]
MSLFGIIDTAKNLGNYPLANAAFACLMELSLDCDRELEIRWESEDPEGEFLWDYYDILVISDGLRSACIPVPLITNRLVWRSLAKIVDRVEHDRNLVEWVDPKPQLTHLRDQLLKLYPNAQELAHKHLEDDQSKGDCAVCPYRVTGHNKGSLYCTVHPFGYPDLPLCPDWEIDLRSRIWVESKI